MIEDVPLLGAVVCTTRCTLPNNQFV